MQSLAIVLIMSWMFVHLNSIVDELHRLSIFDNFAIKGTVIFKFEYFYELRIIQSDNLVMKKNVKIIKHEYNI